MARQRPQLDTVSSQGSFTGRSNNFLSSIDTPYDFYLLEISTTERVILHKYTLVHKY